MGVAGDTAGWLSLLPPLLAIVLSVWTRRVILSLFFGLWLGASMLQGGDSLPAPPPRASGPFRTNVEVLGELRRSQLCHKPTVFSE